ncbi:PCOLCE-AS1 isoform 3 [Pongo abelii]|uniref:PCOLCE-AS1 isoform 3 n=1 Tax=Pongo abelii TaxID=9601 RepID=A0A2J8XUI5_PONAB|nr:PCOLCE-AS1 isoform 3 [Pongo abelii]
MSRASQKKSFCAAIRGIHPTISFIFSMRSCNVWQLWIWLRLVLTCTTSYLSDSQDAFCALVRPVLSLSQQGLRNLQETVCKSHRFGPHL